MGIAYDVPQFAEVIERLNNLALGRFLPVLTRRFGVAMTKQLADEFRESRDPYGVPWAPVVRRRAKDVAARARRIKAGKPAKADKPLIDTSLLRAAAVNQNSVQTSSTAVRIVIPVDYASYHQHGTRRMVRRQIVPTAETGGLGPIWTAALNAESEAVMAQALARNGGR